MAQGDKEMDDATVVASPSFDAMLEARGEAIGEEEPTLQESAYDDATSRDAAKAHVPDPFAATVSGASYDARLDAMGLPIPEDGDANLPAWGEAHPGDAPGVPKTMVLSPQQWGLPPQPQQATSPQPHSPQPYAPQPHSPQHAPQPHAPQPYSPQPYSPQPYSPQPHASQPYSAQAQPARSPAQPARSKSSVTLFLISAAVTLVVFGTCAASVIGYLLLRG